ncbi:transposase [Streptomyces sioyaensis]|uniref:transposase n=1 Tax=Streptomyces sioyaensis TaxID=67364 RepID=UPI0033D3BA11
MPGDQVAGSLGRQHTGADHRRVARHLEGLAARLPALGKHTEEPVTRAHRNLSRCHTFCGESDTVAVTTSASALARTDPASRVLQLPDLRLEAISSGSPSRWPCAPLTDAQCARSQPLLPDRTPKRGGRWRDLREVIDATARKSQTGSQWVHIPERYGSWKGAYNRPRDWAIDGTWERVLTALLAKADADEDPD